jgi:hypothetical protein
LCFSYIVQFSIINRKIKMNENVYEQDVRLFPKTQRWFIEINERICEGGEHDQ